MLVSSTEPKLFHDLGTLGTKPEEWGVDFLWFVQHIRGWAGVQRKEIKDLIASLGDDRLTKEAMQMNELDYRLLVIEGRISWVNDHIVVNKWTKLSREHYTGLVLKLQAMGIAVIHTANMDETYRMVQWYERWTNKPNHTLLTGRSTPPANSWGKRDNRDYGIWLLQSLPGVGYELAGRIYDHFGKVPFSWEVGMDELCQVPGVGKGKAQKMLDCL